MNYLVNEFEYSVKHGDELGHHMLALSIETGLSVVSELSRLQDIEDQYLDLKNGVHLKREEFERLQEIEKKYNLLMAPSTKPEQTSDEKITLRDQMAIAILNGLVSHSGCGSASLQNIQYAYSSADAMLKQRGNV